MSSKVKSYLALTIPHKKITERKSRLPHFFCQASPFYGTFGAWNTLIISPDLNPQAITKSGKLRILNRD